jgi:hypothetical protein
LHRTAARLVVPFFVAALAAPGCGPGNSNRVPVEGTVTLHGQPVAYGAVALQPAAGASGPASGGEIKDGRFSIPRKAGPAVGEYRVRFTVVLEKGEWEARRSDPRGWPPMSTFEARIRVVPDQAAYDFALP